ncbi:MAG: hypothetical protein K9I82_01670 [Chitinophagaceae bacterium]|nr:hypothetical protein [Chitinophagaceae bacterium]
MENIFEKKLDDKWSILQERLQDRVSNKVCSNLEVKIRWKMFKDDSIVHWIEVENNLIIGNEK